MKKKIYFVLLSICVALALFFAYSSFSNTQLSSTFINLKSKTHYFIHCDLDECKMYIFKDGELIKKYPLSGGKDSTRSPYGSWIITDKDKWGEGFGGSWMGFNVPWAEYHVALALFPFKHCIL
ncbi:MAG TPA: hypothetical protein DEP72_01310 [Clostridiales bacterium]|nr:MAG: hypothetical protein A2Y18_05675 [Clostridiales bacterium GWD2_32_19]HCC06791.1 hypothetical protein [Clostridiales bacterium]